MAISPPATPPKRMIKAKLIAFRAKPSVSAHEKDAASSKTSGLRTANTKPMIEPYLNHRDIRLDWLLSFKGFISTVLVLCHAVARQLLLIRLPRQRKHLSRPRPAWGAAGLYITVNQSTAPSMEFLAGYAERMRLSLEGIGQLRNS
jgi:membrane-associated phospholipid phosphatase